jgi:hypothetical protein
LVEIERPLPYASFSATFRGLSRPNCFFGSGYVAIALLVNRAQMLKHLICRIVPVTGKMLTSETILIEFQHPGGHESPKGREQVSEAICIIDSRIQAIEELTRNRLISVVVVRSPMRADCSDRCLKVAIRHFPHKTGCFVIVFVRDVEIHREQIEITARMNDITVHGKTAIPKCILHGTEQFEAVSA